MPDAVLRDVVEIGKRPKPRFTEIEAMGPRLGSAESQDSENEKPRVAPIDVLLAEPDPAESWLVDGVLSERALGMLVANAYMTKSTFAGCLGLHIAAGRDFLGWQIRRPRPVLYWQTEGSVWRFKRRLAVAAAYYRIETQGLPLFLERSGLGEDFRSPAFREVADSVRGGLVIADTSGAFYFGDENSAEDVRAGWTRPLRAVAAACDLSVLTVHHHGKPSKEREGYQKGRGSSALYGDFDTWLRLEAVADEPNRRALYVDKVRDAEAPAPRELDFLKDHAAFAVIGPAEAGSCSDRKVERFEDAVRKAMERTLETLTKNPGISGRKLFEFVRGKRGIFDEAMTRLQKAPDIIGNDGPRGSVLWSRASIRRVNP